MWGLRNYVMKMLIVFCIAIFLVACSDSSSLVATPIDEAVITETTVPTKIVVTPTAAPSLSATPTSTVIHTPVSTPTKTPLPTATPSPTFVPASVGTPVHQSENAITIENVDQLTELAHWGRGVINDVAYSGNGRWIAVATTTGVYIHDAQDLSIEPHFFEASDNVRLVDISLNGDMMAMALDTRTIELWDVAQHEQIWTKEEQAHELQFSPDGQVLAAVTSFERTSRGVIWSLPEGEEIKSFVDLLALQFSADSTNLAVWSYGDLTIYEWPTGKILSQTEPVLLSDTTEDEVDAQGTVISDVQFDIGNEPILLNLPINTAYGTTGRVEFQRGSDNSLLLSLPPIELLSYPIQAACDEGLFFADPPARPQVWQYEFLPEAQIVALKYEDIGYMGDDRTYTSVRFHRLDNGQQLYTQDGVNAFSFSPDKETWVSGMQDGRLQIRRMIDGEVLQTYDGYESPINEVIVAPDGQLVAVEYLDEVKLYRVQDGTVFRRYPANRIAFAPDGTTIALGYENGRIELRNLADDTLLNTLSAHEEAVTALAFMPMEDTLISAGMDCQLNIWQLQDGTLSGSLENYFVTTLASDEETIPLRMWEMLITPDGEWLFGAFLSSFGVWQLADGTIQESFTAGYHVADIVLSVSGDYLATTYPLQLWQMLPAGEMQEVWQVDYGTAVAFSPDGQLLIAGLDENYLDQASLPNESANGALQIQLVKNGELLHRLSPGTRKVTAIAFDSDAHFFVSASLDGVVRLWGVP
jgi:WD40 repeat protein